MSSSICHNKIILTRGDTLRAPVTIILPDGTPYVPSASDQIKFTVKRHATDTKELITKYIPVDKMELYLESEDTEDLSFDIYQYDMKLIRSNGDVHTFIPCSPFQLTEEVG